MQAQGFYYARPDYARHLADGLTGQLPVNYTSGLFLAAPRRTGKSSFLRRELIPELERRGVLCVYADLWADTTRNPADLIAEAIRRKIEDLEPHFSKKAGVSLAKLGIPGFVSIDLDTLGKSGGTTLGDALSHLQAKHHARVALVIDEAQHALVSPEGRAALFALKAARDAINQNASPEKPNLLLVFTGSNRGKLASLVNERAQPFFGARLLDFPLLGRGFTDAFTASINRYLRDERQLDPEDIAAAFAIIGARPEHIGSIVEKVVFGPSERARLGDALRQEAERQRSQLYGDIIDRLAKLTPLQRAILDRLAEKGPEQFTPFNAESLSDYSRNVGKRITASQAQAALERLKALDLVWNPQRGVYAFEEPDTIGILRTTLPKST